MLGVQADNVRTTSGGNGNQFAYGRVSSQAADLPSVLRDTHALAVATVAGRLDRR